MIEDPTLSPRAAIGPSGGPRNWMPAASRAAGSSGYSEAWPQPGHTASAWAWMAVSTMSRTLA